MPFDLTASNDRRARAAAAVQALAASGKSPADFKAAQEKIQQARREHAAACEAQRASLSTLNRPAA